MESAPVRAGSRVCPSLLRDVYDCRESYDVRKDACRSLSSNGALLLNCSFSRRSANFVAAEKEPVRGA